jgi:Kef-type K+ transport system membrane component KefB
MHSTAASAAMCLTHCCCCCCCRRSESIRTGFLLSQGGEFAFVLLSLACQLKLLPEELNQILIITGETRSIYPFHAECINHTFLPIKRGQP